jgi:hypothetical protein
LAMALFGLEGTVLPQGLLLVRKKPTHPRNPLHLGYEVTEDHYCFSQSVLHLPNSMMKAKNNETQTTVPMMAAMERFLACFPVHIQNLEERLEEQERVNRC